MEEKSELGIDSPLRYKRDKKLIKIAIIGAGWYGVHLALSLAKKGYSVTLYECNAEIFSGVSGILGIRIHAGPHYPRSPATRQSCRIGFLEFCEAYPELVNQHEYAIYAIGKEDADGKPSKTTEQEFRSICEEFQYKGEIDLKKSGYNPDEILAAFDINEPSAVLGSRLRSIFLGYLKKYPIEIKYNFFVTRAQKIGAEILVGNEDECEKFDYVINTTSYKSLLPKKISLPFGAKIVYQVCLALTYQDLTPGQKPISFIVMDGWFPCLMPYDNRIQTDRPVSEYVLTHGKWTIVGSYSSAAEANAYLAHIDDGFVEQYVRPPCETDIIKFFPAFEKRFKYLSWKGVVLAKIQTNKEFRGAVVFQENEMMYVFPGKITNIFEAEREILALMQKKGVITKQGFQYMERGVLSEAKEEISEQIAGVARNTCALQTFTSVLQKKMHPDLKISISSDEDHFALHNSRHKVGMKRMERNLYYLLFAATFVYFFCKNAREESTFCLSTISKVVLGFCILKILEKISEASMCKKLSLFGMFKNNIMASPSQKNKASFVEKKIYRNFY